MKSGLCWRLYSYLELFHMLLETFVIIHPGTGNELICCEADEEREGRN